MVMSAKHRGNDLTSLYSVNKALWFAICEDIFQSPAAESVEARIASTFYSREEFEAISVDATLKLCLSVRGQASYRAPREVRAMAPFDDSNSYRKIMTVRGRTGAVLSMEPLPGEKAEDLRAGLAASLSQQALAQVRFMSVDDPSAKLLEVLREICPNLSIMALDSVHLAITCEYATWRKRTAGSTFLRRIMSKFNICDSSMDSTSWGPAFAGDKPCALDRREEIARDQIAKRNMSAARAKRIEEELDDTKPFYCRIEVIEAMAALCALHPQEVMKKVTGANKPLYNLLWSAIL
jgi:hypothetical protein